MTTQFDYLGFLENTYGGNTTKVRPASQGQIKYYNDLCKQRGIKPQPSSNFNFDTMSAEIQKLMSFYPASTAQIKTINDIIGRLSAALENMNFTPEQVEAFRLNTSNIVSVIIAGLLDKNLNLNNIIAKLTGGKDGTASKLIGSLIDVEKNFSNNQPPTDKQLEILVNMFLCPDVPFENFGISRRVDLGEDLWRKPSPEEFAASIKANMNKSDASKFIDDYRGVFYEWKQTRISLEQMRYIMELEQRMGSQAPTTEITFSVNLEGETEETSQVKREYIKGVEYTPHTQEQLIQMSREDASNFIDQLKAELNRREGSTLTEPTVDLSNLRSVTSVDELNEIEYSEFEDLMYKLESVAGYSYDELHDAARFSLVSDDDPEHNVKNRQIIRDFMRDLLRTEAITFHGLIELASETPTAIKILCDL